MITEKKYKQALKIIKEYENENFNVFQKMPLHWRYIYYMSGGIIIGVLLTYIFLI